MYVIVSSTYKYISIWIFIVLKVEFILKSDFFFDPWLQPIKTWLTWIGPIDPRGAKLGRGTS